MLEKRFLWKMVLVSGLFLLFGAGRGAYAGAADLYLPTQKIALGEVMHGEFAKGSFALENRGDAPLELTDIESSCGCTVIDFKPRLLEPGERATFDVSVDTIGKVGEIRKKITVHSNDPDTPEADLYVYLRVKLAEHESIDPAALFKGDCAYCHAKPAGEKEGEALFEAVCFMCHGHYGLGGLALRINDFGYVSNSDDGYFRRVIREGVPGTSMPAFGGDKGGPLSESQIESLVQLMRWWEEGYVFKANEKRR